MRVKNTHWTYCTQFSQSYKNIITPLFFLALSAPPWANCTPLEKKRRRRRRQQGTLLSCQLMINGSASHLHHHSHNVPPLTAHTLFHCSEKLAAAGPRGAFDIVWMLPSIYFACNLALMANVIQNIRSCLSAYPSWLRLLWFPLSAANTSTSAACFMCSLKKKTIN